MIRFNRAISPFTVLSFDLDDTLYNNHPIITAAVQAQINYLNALPNWQAQGKDYWQQCREQALLDNPELVDNVTQWRKSTLRTALAKLGYQNAELEHHANNAYQAFADARSQIVVDDKVLDLLSQLSKRYRLIAITNGNVEIERFNLNGVFELVLQAGIHGKAKPHTTMFEQAAAALGVPTQHILHVGDSLDTDVQGAHNAGCQSLWLNDQPAKYAYKGLADIEITDIQALKHFLSQP
ncbi:MAG: HAD superfamily hydrolase (TIGR01549 family) [Pseudoalteromonas rhizosphaerae]|jgi:HAD superfamily hydrolase (TIGR01549 family)|uniref:HAD-IA family hydrolase n=1 Tax=Pseudoalteromonas neustonica TaxID=1840331 RepID=A0ABY3FB67_9GAMM|nr:MULTISPECIES: HAD-IA family hydrolase [Pseudoalteromonas]MBB1507103.1 HAD-IA family hydrolase [Pseudoalteromonas sp. SG41-1]TVU81942.1 HAD-IA family hydrolase [Pseudoalteromonas neustonica]|tara:strand:- start:24460 stop:25173 length:714 start_codon:yes stop_codon:yes gene_type:complete